MSTIHLAEVAFVSGLKSLASSLEWSGIGLAAGVQLPVQGRHDGELFITVGSYRREISLPRVLAQRETLGATIDDGELKVRFGSAT